ncbi:PAS domain-containing protein [Rhodospirillaceae bacterium SYSU D60014]|uniref:sensor histidine kinase n=1 Tax=Virgifigura deserti TaxID=2268457 RepID=UPI000E66FA6C
MAILSTAQSKVLRPSWFALPEWAKQIKGRRHVQLFALAATAVLPILIFSIVMVVLFDRQQQHSVEQILRQSALSAMAAIDRELASHIATLEALADSPRIDDRDMAGVYRHAKRVLDSRHEWLTMRLSDAKTHRQIINLLTPLGDVLPSALDPEDIDTVVETRRPLIGSVRPADTSDTEPSVILRVPVIRDGTVLYTLSASVRAEAFSEILINHGIPEGWIATVIDQQNTIVGRNVSQKAFVGTPALVSMPVMEGDATGGFLFVQSKEGDPLYAAISSSYFSGWTVAVGAPVDIIEGPLRRSLLVVGGGGVTALLLALALATILTRNLAGRHEAEQRLAGIQAEQTAERRLTDIAANFPGLIYRRALQADGLISFPYISARAEPLMGLKPEQIKRQMPLEEFGRQCIFAEDLPRWRDAVLVSARTLEPYRLEYRIRDPEGGVRWVRSMAYAQREGDGTVVWDGVMLDISDLKETELALRDSDERLRLAVEATELGAWDWNPQNASFTCSDRSKSIFGLALEVPVDYQVFLARVHPEDRQRTHRALKHALDPGGVAELNLEFRSRWPDGTVRWVAARGQAMFDDDESVRRAVRFIGTVRDITARKSSEEALAAALAEQDNLLQQKDTLLREIHHRVKNNLQVISSLMNLEALQVEDDDARERLRLVSQRIVILGNIHEQLYRSDDFARIDIGARLQEICRSLASLYRNDAVTVTVDAEKLFCNIETAIPIGLITNELVSNCFKHGFRDGRSGWVHVSLRRMESGTVSLVVADNGAGLPAAPQDLRHGLGMRVTSALAKQIDAVVRFESDEGTQVTLTAPGRFYEG